MSDLFREELARRLWETNRDEEQVPSWEQLKSPMDEPLKDEFRAMADTALAFVAKRIAVAGEIARIFHEHLDTLPLEQRELERAAFRRELGTEGQRAGDWWTRLPHFPALCTTTGNVAENGRCPTHGGDSCLAAYVQVAAVVAQIPERAGEERRALLDVYELAASVPLGWFDTRESFREQWREKITAVERARQP